MLFFPKNNQRFNRNYKDSFIAKIMISHSKKEQINPITNCMIFTCLNGQESPEQSFKGFKSPKRSLKKSLSQQFSYFNHLKKTHRQSIQQQPHTDKTLQNNHTLHKRMSISKHNHSNINIKYQSKQITEQNLNTAKKYHNYKISGVQPMISRIKVVQEPKNNSQYVNNYTYGMPTSIAAAKSQLAFKMNTKTYVQTANKNIQKRQQNNQMKQPYKPVYTQIFQNQLDRSMQRTASTTTTLLHVNSYKNLNEKPSGTFRNIKVEPFKLSHNFKSINMTESNFIAEQSVNGENIKSSLNIQDIDLKSGKLQNRLVVSYMSQNSQQNQSVVCQTQHKYKNGKIKTLF